jgi:hypothetical protein
MERGIGEEEGKEREDKGRKEGVGGEEGKKRKIEGIEKVIGEEEGKERKDRRKERWYRGRVRGERWIERGWVKRGR